MNNKLDDTLTNLGMAISIFNKQQLLEKLLKDNIVTFEYDGLKIKISIDEEGNNNENDNI